MTWKSAKNAVALALSIASIPFCRAFASDTPAPRAQITSDTGRIVHIGADQRKLLFDDRFRTIGSPAELPASIKRFYAGTAKLESFLAANDGQWQSGPCRFMQQGKAKLRFLTAACSPRQCAVLHRSWYFPTVSWDLFKLEGASATLIASSGSRSDTPICTNGEKLIRTIRLQCLHAQELLDHEMGTQFLGLDPPFEGTRGISSAAPWTDDGPSINPYKQLLFSAVSSEIKEGATKTVLLVEVTKTGAVSRTHIISGDGAVNDKLALDAVGKLKLPPLPDWYRGQSIPFKVDFSKLPAVVKPANASGEQQSPEEDSSDKP